MHDPHHLLRVTLQAVRDAVVTIDQAECILMLNQAAESLTGWSCAEAIGKPVGEVIHLQRNGYNATGASPLIASLAAGRSSRRMNQLDRLDKLDQLTRNGHFLLLGRDGRRAAVQIAASPLKDAHGNDEGRVLILHDVDEAQQLAERFAHQAQHDPLTGLPNRTLLVDRMEQAAKHADRSSEQVVVIFVDLDHFNEAYSFTEIKSIFGPLVADDLLLEVACRLTYALRESDTVCRLGGGEFVLLLPGVKSLDDVETLAAKLLAEIARPYYAGDHTFKTSSSIGIAIYPRDAAEVATLMRLADGAMSQARKSGRNRYLFVNAGLGRTAPLI